MDLYDVIVVGGGPAGLTSAIYLARAKYRVLVLEKEKFGGQITITEEIVNYPGVEKASGRSLTEGMRRQAEHFGAEFAMANVSELITGGDIKKVRTDSGKEYETLGIILALGASPRKLGFEGEKEFQGRGVAYCATCDGEFFADREVLVIGGGFAAVEESVFLTKYASKVIMIVREPDFTCAAGVADKVRECPDIEVRFNTEVEAVFGEKFLTGARLRNNETGEVYEYAPADGKPFGVFVFAGYEPATKWIEGTIALNEQGYILTDREQGTDVEGVYAAGDVCVKGLRQVVTAVGDGAVAATSLEHYVSGLRDRLGMPEADWEKADTGKDVNADASEDINAGTRKDVSADASNEIKEKAFVDTSMRGQLEQIFGKFTDKVTVAAVLNGRGASQELEGFAHELEGISDKVNIVVEQMNSGSKDALPYLDIRKDVPDKDNSSTGIRYYSVPGGHEFNSFVLALYNTAGPGQELDENMKARIKALNREHTIQVMATLSCTNCPDVVAGTQHIAAISNCISAQMYDLAKFPEYKDRYGIMAVPCIILDGEETFFGKKSLDELVRILEQAG